MEGPRQTADGFRGVDARGWGLTPKQEPGTTIPGSPAQFMVGGETFATRQEAEDYRQSLGNNIQYAGPPSFDAYEGPTSSEEFTADPGYQFRLSQGEKAIERRAAAKGLRLSSGTLKDFGRFADGMASQEYNNWWNRRNTEATNRFNQKNIREGNYYNRLAGIAGVGQTATQQQIAAGQNFANNAGQNYLAAGNAQAQGIIGVNNAIQGGINSGYNVLGMMQAGLLGPGAGELNRLV